MLARERGSFAPIMAPALAAHSINRCRLVVDAPCASIAAAVAVTGKLIRDRARASPVNTRSANGRRPLARTY